MNDVFRTIDPGALPKHFDARATEARCDAQRQREGVYHYDPERPPEQMVVVDTPPPTVSGSVPVGHVYSDTHTDVIVRQRRMLGNNVFYPLGWDDNGLPTEFVDVTAAGRVRADGSTLQVDDTLADRESTIYTIDLEPRHSSTLLKNHTLRLLPRRQCTTRSPLECHNNQHQTLPMQQE